jgi:hypothetical protein
MSSHRSESSLVTDADTLRLGAIDGRPGRIPYTPHLVPLQSGSLPRPSNATTQIDSLPLLLQLPAEKRPGMGARGRRLGLSGKQSSRVDTTRYYLLLPGPLVYLPIYTKRNGGCNCPRARDTTGEMDVCVRDLAWTGVRPVMASGLQMGHGQFAREFPNERIDDGDRVTIDRCEKLGGQRFAVCDGLFLLRRRLYRALGNKSVVCKFDPVKLSQIHSSTCLGHGIRREIWKIIKSTGPRAYRQIR